MRLSTEQTERFPKSELPPAGEIGKSIPQKHDNSGHEQGRADEEEWKEEVRTLEWDHGRSVLAGGVPGSF